MHILIIEDNEFNQIVLHDLIQLEYPEIQFTMVSNADDAFKQDYNLIDLILSDISMSPINGFEIYTYLKDKLGVTSPIVAVTAMAISGDKEKILTHGFDAYLSKPIITEELYALINKYIKG